MRSATVEAIYRSAFGADYPAAAQPGAFYSATAEGIIAAEPDITADMGAHYPAMARIFLTTLPTSAKSSPSHTARHTRPDSARPHGTLRVSSRLSDVIG
jgi:hypothetical protein